MVCTYCERPLECAACRTLYLPPTQAHFDALSRPEIPLACQACGETLVCHWCKTPYDGGEGEDAED
jgi:hypothetical protein